MEKKVIQINGYSAFDKISGKGLRSYCSNWTNKWGLTTDVEKVAVAESKQTIKMYADWYNEQHKNKVEFVFKKVTKIYTTELVEVQV